MVTPLEYAARIAYSSKEVLRFTYDMAKKYASSEGVYVECGVAAGAQLIAMKAGAPDKVIYAFDSFAGIPLPSNRDDQMPGIAFLSKAEQKALPDPGKQVLESSGATIVPLKDVVDHLNASGVGIQKVYFVKGWFEETLPEFDCPPISILRLDGDLYNSTYVALKYLYPKVIKGGIVIIDDYALPGCRAAVLDYFGVSVPDIMLMYSGESTIAYWERKHASRTQP